MVPLTECARDHVLRRIESENVPAETRHMLRERLMRFLPTYSVRGGHIGAAVRPLVSDSDILGLLWNLNVSCGNDVACARRLYEKAVQSRLDADSSLQENAGQPNDSASTRSLFECGSAPAVDPDGNTPRSKEPVSADRQYSDSALVSPSADILRSTSPSLDGLSPPPSFDELIEHGWIRVSWGRIHVPEDIWLAVLRSQETVDTPFRQMIDKRHQDAFDLRSGFNPSGPLGDIANSIIHDQSRPGEVACISREWIAARLWDTLPEPLRDLSSEQRMRRWVDNWRLLNGPRFSLSSYCERTSFSEFVGTAIGVLEAPSTTPGWEEFRGAAGAPLALLYPDRRNVFDNSLPAIPTTAVERIRWLAHQIPEQTFRDYVETGGSSLLTVLLNELADATFDSLALAPRLMDIAVERPVLLQQIVLRAQQTPALLADMLTSPSTCTVACSLIANWHYNDGGWNRAFQAPANRATELLAFEDALAILGGHVDEGRLHSDELAALYLYVYELALNSRQPSNRFTMLSMLREELVASGQEVQDAAVADLIATAGSKRDPTTTFCAALDLASDGGCAERLDPSGLVSLYVNAVLPLGGELAPRMLELKSAQLFVAMALRCSDTLRNCFLGAIDMHAWLGAAPADESERYSYHDLLRRRIRLHIRVICRAIAGWPDEIPVELIENLVRSVFKGATNRPEREALNAFTLGFTHSWAPMEQPISFDLAAALRRVQGSAVQRLVVAFCQIEEPAVLAGIVANIPATLNAPIMDRLQNLTPSTSPEVWSLTALQARVDALLSANLPDVAQTFIDAEQHAKTLGAVPGREITQLRANLRVLLLRKDWPAVGSYLLPENMPGPVRREAHDTLLFYRAIAHLQNPEGDAAIAEAIFADLSNRHHAIAAYRVNLFASRVRRLFHNDVLQLLSGAALSEARRHLAEAERETRPLIQHSPSDLKPLDMNRAILLLGVNRPRESLQVLLELGEAFYEADIECFRALAMARLGRKREALAVLEQARRVVGESGLLSAVRENMDTHRPYVTAPSLSLSDDPVPGIRHALEAFGRLGHTEQAEALQLRGRLDLYLLEQVRGACAALVATVPMMRNLGIAREDDISAILKQILRASLQFPQWTVDDQSRGGFSKSGGVGERDITISKGLVTLAVLEALIVDTVETVNLTSHFKKLLGYDTCLYFFHVTYARRAKWVYILDHLRQSCTAPPNGFTYSRLEDLEDLDSMPRGFKAYYKAEDRDIIVCFLVLDMGQEAQRSAAMGNDT